MNTLKRYVIKAKREGKRSLASLFGSNGTPSRMLVEEISASHDYTTAMEGNDTRTIDEVSEYGSCDDCNIFYWSASDFIADAKQSGPGQEDEADYRAEPFKSSDIAWTKCMW